MPAACCQRRRLFPRSCQLPASSRAEISWPGRLRAGFTAGRRRLRTGWNRQAKQHRSSKAFWPMRRQSVLWKAGQRRLHEPRIRSVSMWVHKMSSAPVITGPGDCFATAILFTNVRPYDACSSPSSVTICCELSKRECQSAQVGYWTRNISIGWIPIFRGKPEFGRIWTIFQRGLQPVWSSYLLSVGHNRHLRGIPNRKE